MKYKCSNIDRVCSYRKSSNTICPVGGKGVGCYDMIFIPELIVKSSSEIQLRIKELEKHYLTLKSTKSQQNLIATIKGLRWCLEKEE